MSLAAKLFSALGSEDRLRIVNLLLAEKDGVCVCELVDALRIPQYEVSRQLGVLRECGVVSGVKRGTWVYYGVQDGLPSLEGAILEAIRDRLTDDTYRNDRERLAGRLLIRTSGVCTIGYPVDAPYREVIPLREVSDHV